MKCWSRIGLRLPEIDSAVGRASGCGHQREIKCSSWSVTEGIRRLGRASGLFLGSVGVAYNKDALRNLNVTHILIVAKSLEPAFPNDFIYKKIDVLDSPDEKLEVHFDECFHFIDEARTGGGGVLVHCFAGRSRSFSTTIFHIKPSFFSEKKKKTENESSLDCEIPSHLLSDIFIEE
ncbi:Dual specificity protein phosphatase 1 [Acorus gramineus]|uniref:protein-tyrosine-phosphatase n=1 Tax=Acorus gramineus TaxID=55184 RepID=A0AAV9BRC7_ACOGR|nr:Dual specificity protein phosphatase 1 [Acorus gramineus]